MVKALLDTNIIVDFFNGVPQARRELRRYETRAISIISWMEVMVGAESELATTTRAVLTRFDLIGLDQDIADRAVSLRRTHRMKLPDAVIWASAQRHDLLLVTRNTKDFPTNDPGVRHPYSL